MRKLIPLIVLTAVLAVSLGIAMYDTSDTSASADTEYIVYYMIDDPRLGSDQYSINLSGVYVTDTYVFYKNYTGSSTAIGTLPSTENIVSRFYDTNLADDGFALNPEGSTYGYDVSGWFKEDSYQNRVTSTTTMEELDQDGDGVIVLHMKAAKVYDVKYHIRNSINKSWSGYYSYDGYHLEREYPNKYNRNLFTEVDYVVSLVEGQPVPSNLPTTANMYCPDRTGDILYLPISNWAKDDGSYNMDVYEYGGHSFSWVLRSSVNNYPNITASNCTPVYEGLVVTSALDPENDGIIELYGTSARTQGEDPSFFFTIVFAQEDTAGKTYGETGYTGYSESRIDKIGAVKVNTTVTSDEYRFLLPEFDGFVYDTFTKDSNVTCTVAYDTVNGVSGYYATVSGTANTGDLAYSGSVVFHFERQTVDIRVIGENTTVIPAKYGCDVVIPSTFSSHTLYGWEISGLSNNIWESGAYYYYTVSLEDLDAVNPTITAVWQEDHSQHPVYTIQYVSRVNDITLVSDVVDEDGYITLPMIVYEGYSHLGWALVNPDEEIDLDTTTLVIYPGRTSLRPSEVSSAYKIVNPQNNNMITVRLYAIWCTTYTIHFDSNGGLGHMDDAGPIMANENYILPANAFTKNNATFVGWSLTKNGTVKYTDQATIKALAIDSNDVVNLYAVWSVTSTAYVVYDANGGTGTMNSQSVTLNNGSGRVTLNSNQFTRDGYSFYGWSLTYENSIYDPSMSISGNFVKLGGQNIGYKDGASNITVTGSISLYAIWKPNTYYVDFDANGGIGSMERQTFTYGTPQSLAHGTFTRQGYMFGGWSTVNGTVYTDGYIVNNLTTTQGGVVVLYAIWIHYYVSFDSNNGSGLVDTYTAYNGIEFTIPECPFTYANHLFITWNTAANGSGISYDPGDVILNAAPDGETFQLYAIWELYTYTVYFDPNGGTGSMSPYVASGGVAFNIPNNTFTYSNRQFLGWSKSPGAQVPDYTDHQSVTDIAEGEDSVTLYAIWSGHILNVRVSSLKNSPSGTTMAYATAAFGVDAIVEGDLITLKLTGTYTQYESYDNYGTTMYLVSFKCNGVEYTYGSRIVATDVMDTYYLVAQYAEYRSTVRYHMNMPGESDTYTDISFKVTKNQGRYNGTTILSECMYDYPGYYFCGWSEAANTLTNVMAAETSKTYGNAKNPNQIYDLYAVWITVSIDDQYYSGSAKTPSPTVLGYYGTTTGAAVSTTNHSYSNNVNAGVASISFQTSTAGYCNTEIHTTFLIKPARVVIVVADNSKYYGQDDPAFGLTSITSVDASVAGLTVDIERVSGENAGTYDITASFSNINYTLTSLTTGTFTINPAIVTVVVDDSEKTYGEGDPAFTGTATCNTTAPIGLLSISYYRTDVEDDSIGIHIDVLTARYLANPNYTVLITPGTFTILEPVMDTVYYIILDGRGGGDTYTDTASVLSGSPFPSKTVVANAGYSFYEWVKATYSGDTIIALTHITYSNTLDSGDITAGETYIAMFTAGDGIIFNSNGGTGSMEMQEFGNSDDTLSENTFEKEGYIFLGWSLTIDGPVKYTDRTPLFKVSGLSTTDNQNVLYAVWAPYTYTSTLEWNVGAEPNQIMMMNNGDCSIEIDDRTFTPEAVISDKEDIGLILKVGAISFTMVCAAGAAIVMSRRR